MTSWAALVNNSPLYTKSDWWTWHFLCITLCIHNTCELGVPHPKNLKFCTVNVHSLRNKTEDFMDHIIANNIEIRRILFLIGMCIEHRPKPFCCSAEYMQEVFILFIIKNLMFRDKKTGLDSLHIPTSRFRCNYGASWFSFPWTVISWMLFCSFLWYQNNEGAL